MLTSRPKAARRTPVALRTKAATGFTASASKQDAGREGDEVFIPKGSVKVYSAHLPGLLPGQYKLTVEQTVTNNAGQSIEPTTTKNFNVWCPRFALDDADIHSVYPAPAHSALANTLPHVAFNDPHMPWERRAHGSFEGDLAKNPWMAVMSFTEDELRVDLTVEPFGKLKLSQSPTHTIPLTVEKLKGLKGVATPWNGGAVEGFLESDPLAVVLLEPAVFKRLFSSYPYKSTTPRWGGSADTSRFAYLAHARKTNLEGTLSGMGTGSDEFSYVVGSRVAPSSSSPQAIVSHLISLEGLDSMVLSDDDSHVALVSLYSWTWMALPDTEDVEKALRVLGENVAPLRLYPRPQAAKAAEAMPEGVKQWLQKRTEDGYMLCRHVLPSGEETTALFRGVLSPVRRHKSPEGVFSRYGTDLQIMDDASGLMDVSLYAAWELGKNLALSDGAFSTSLLALRGLIHLHAVQAAQAAVEKGLIKRTALAKDLRTVLQRVRGSHAPAEASKAKTALRWTQRSTMRNRRAECSMTNSNVRKAYYASLKTSTEKLSKYTEIDDAEFHDGRSPVSQHWHHVLQWIMDKLCLAGISSVYLVPDQNTLPSESIRTFYVDEDWLEAVVDGALAVANHFLDDDDNIRKEIKHQLNEYLTASSSSEAPPRLPKWGIMIRSHLIQAFPDLTVTVKDAFDNDINVLSVERPSPDMLVGLLDRIPDDGAVSEIILSQPPHQQSFALGSRVIWTDKEEDIEFFFRYLPNVPGKTLKNLPEEGTAKKVALRRADSTNVVFDWENRVLIPGELAERCAAELTLADFAEWSPDWRQRSSALLAAQLSRGSFKLSIHMPASGTRQARQVWRPSKLGVPARPALEAPVPNLRLENPHRHLGIPLPTGSRPPAPIVSIDDPSLHKPRSLPAVRRIQLDNIDAEPFIVTNLYSPGSRQPNTIPGAPSTTQDIIFEIKPRSTFTNLQTFVRRVTVLIPLAENLVVLGHEQLVSDSAAPAWARSHSSWYPTVLPLNKGCRWMYDVALAEMDVPRTTGTGGTAGGGGQNDVVTQKCLAVRILPRTHNEGWAIDQTTDLTFSLRGVRTAGAAANYGTKASVWVLEELQELQGGRFTLRYVDKRGLRYISVQKTF